MKHWTPGDIFSLSGAYWAGCALQAAVQLDLFSVLDGRGKSLAELAAELDCDERALSMLVSALLSMQLVRRHGDTIAAPDDLLGLLSRNSPDYIGFIVNHHAAIMKNWMNLAQAVREGSLEQRQETVFTDDAKAREDFLMGMFNIARLQAGRVADALDLSGRAALMDIGGGPGTYAIHFCLKNPKLSATVFDLPTTEPFARKTIARYDLQNRVDFTPGNFHDDPLPGGQDVAWISQVLHGEAPEDAARLVKKAGAALKPGGLICVQEFALNDDRSGPEHAALFNLNMLVQTPGGQAYSVGEIDDMLRAAGAVTVRTLDIQLPQSCAIIIGEMP